IVHFERIVNMNTGEIERLIKISRERPLMPDSYIPWQEEVQPGDIYLPETLTSLQGLPVYDTLTPTQKLDLGRHELVQVIISYAVFCLIKKRLLALSVSVRGARCIPDPGLAERARALSVFVARDHLLRLITTLPRAAGLADVPGLR